MKKLLKYTGIGLLILLLLAFLVPILFKGRIVTLVKSEINKNLTAKVDFKDVSLSFFRHFPKLSLNLEDLSVVGTGEFASDTVLSAAAFDASVNVMNLIRGEDISVYGVFLEKPRIHALVNKEGRANWEIAKANAGTASVADSSSFKVKLQRYAIHNGYIKYEDKTLNMAAEVTGLDHEGKGDITQDIFTMATKTKALSATVVYQNIPYLINAQAGIDADVEINNQKSTYTFKNASLLVNELKVLANGFFRLDNDSTYSMDISFNAPTNEFKNFLSLVPAIYKTDFDKLKTSGTAAFKGFVKGTYSNTSLPAYDIDLAIQNGFFQYPDLPQPVKNITIAARFSNRDGAMDNTVVDIQKGHLEFGADPFDFRLRFTNPETIRYIDAGVKGRINFSEITRFVKLEPGTKLAGLIQADAYAKGNLTALQQQSGPFSAGGFLTIENLFYASKAFLQPIHNGSFRIALQNTGGSADATTVDISSGHLEVGMDAFDFNLKLSQPVTAVNFMGDLKGKFTLDNIKQFVALEPGTAISGKLSGEMSFKGSKQAIDRKAYEQIGLNGVASLEQVRYASKAYPSGMTIQNARFSFNPNVVQLNNFAGSFMGTALTADGVLTNMLGYALHNETLQGRLNVAADKINLNDWMGTDTASATNSASMQPVKIPANIDMVIQARADDVVYDQVHYQQVNGALVVKNETVQLQQVQTRALDGSVTFNGSYSTRENKEKPAIALNYDIKDIDIQKAFMAYNTVQKLMPVGKFLSGKMSSQFTMTGRLNGDLMPDLNSLTGNGNILLLQGVLRQFQPMEKLAGQLNVSQLKDISLKDIKSHFEFANGKVLVRPFHLQVKDIEMEIGGMHGFDQAIDYIIGMKLPRSYLGTSGNAFVNNLAAQAGSKGIPVALSDQIDLNVRMGGTITNPVLKTDLKQVAGDATKELKQQATAFVQQKADSARREIKDSFAVVKKQVMEDVKQEIGKQLLGSKDSSSKGVSFEQTKDKAAETVKGTLGSLFGKKKKPAADSTKKE
ncbi:MAG TPA: AsmA-like C-terminal region-containing protein [Flavisolibacter sp.]|jgi:hypothetical protein|nr:AsmA-like C-terminal region-containing protein [Flavisolibacter sp.]